ncbi:hypothetical protein [Photobacterium indicum]|nr:hypothetical protein [Photobacterium indicum]
MNAKTKGYAVTAGTAVIALLVAGGVVWVSNNVDAVEDQIS